MLARQPGSLIFLLFLNFLFSLCAFLFAHDVSFFFASALGPCLVMLFFRFTQKEDVFLFLLFYLIYTVCSLATYYIDIWQFGSVNTFPDQNGYFAVSFAFLENPSIPDFAATSYLSILDRVDWVGYQLFLSSVGWVFDKISENTFLSIKTTSSLFGALSVVYTYRLAHYFVVPQKAFRCAVFFGLLPCMLMISSVLLRDIIILFFTTFVLLHLLHFVNGKRRSICSLIFGLFCLYFLRPENGAFMTGVSLTIFAYHIWNRVSLLCKIFLGFLMLGFSIGLFEFFYSSFFMKFTQILPQYFLRSVAMADETSLAKRLLLFPFPINIFSMTFFSQLMPFPLWGTVCFGYVRVFEMFGGVIWFPLFVLSLIEIFIKRYRQKLDGNIVLFYIFALLHISLVSIAQANVRRLMAWYPVIFLVGYLGFQNFSKKLKKQYVFCAILLSFLLHLAYLKIKY